MIGTNERALMSYLELTEEWQKEARSDHCLDTLQHTLFIEPCAHHVPGTHVLHDLNECMPGVEPNTGIIGISNNSALRLHFDADMESCTLEYI